MKTRTKRCDHHLEVVAKIRDQLAKGVLPWHRPWQVGGGSAVEKPLRECGTAYQGINIILLWTAALEAGYGSSYWMTYRQAQRRGGQVRRGESATRVFFAKPITVREKRETEQAESSANADEERKRIYLRKAYAVFNADQIEGLPARFESGRVDEGTKEEPYPLESWFSNLDVPIRTGGSLAFYSPAEDRIQMPPRPAFESADLYFATLCHEAVHATGAKHRLDRQFGQRGTSAYAFEELVAELGSAFLCADLGIESSPRDDHAAYIGHWLKLLDDQPNALFAAGTKAEQAVAYLRGLQPGQEDDSETVRADDD